MILAKSVAGEIEASATAREWMARQSSYTLDPSKKKKELSAESKSCNKFGFQLSVDFVQVCTSCGWFWI